MANFESDSRLWRKPKLSGCPEDTTPERREEYTPEEIRIEIEKEKQRTREFLKKMSNVRQGSSFGSRGWGKGAGERSTSSANGALIEKESSDRCSEEKSVQSISTIAKREHCVLTAALSPRISRAQSVVVERRIQPQKEEKTCYSVDGGKAAMDRILRCLPRDQNTLALRYMLAETTAGKTSYFSMRQTGERDCDHAGKCGCKWEVKGTHPVTEGLIFIEAVGEKITWTTSVASSFTIAKGYVFRGEECYGDPYPQRFITYQEGWAEKYFRQMSNQEQKKWKKKFGNFLLEPRKEKGREWGQGGDRKQAAVWKVSLLPGHKPQSPVCDWAAGDCTVGQAYGDRYKVTVEHYDQKESPGVQHQKKSHKKWGTILLFHVLHHSTLGPVRELLQYQDRGTRVIIREHDVPDATVARRMDFLHYIYEIQEGKNPEKYVGQSYASKNEWTARLGEIGWDLEFSTQSVGDDRSYYASYLKA